MPGVCHSGPFARQSPFRTLRQYFSMYSWLQLLSECSKWRLPSKWAGVAHACNMHHRTSTDMLRQSMCDICFCISWPEISQRASSHCATDSIHRSMCDICFVFLGQKHITIILAHRPIRFTGRCAICAFMPPKRRFWKTKQPVGRVFSRDFSRMFVQ